MKILIDPISTNDPAYCSCHYKMQQMCRYLLEQRDDVIIYYLIPDPATTTFEIDQDWLLKSDRLRYIPSPATRDRMREYAQVPAHLQEYVAFNGELWDWDVLITSRSTQVATLRMWMSRANAWDRRLVVIDDEFPIMSFKQRVNQPYPESGDLLALTGYASADHTLVMSMASRKLILNRARDLLSPALCNQLQKKLVTSASRQFTDLKLKPDAYVQSVGKEKVFTCANVQRLSSRVHRKDGVLETFFNQFALHGGEGKMRFLITSNSTVTDAYKIPDFSHIEVMRCRREEFWRLLDEEVDLVMGISNDEDYPLSLIEPVCKGVPLVVMDAPYVKPTFGKDYPFIVTNMAQAYAMVTAFRTDYAAQYEKFRQWFDWWRGEMERRNDIWFPLQLREMIQDYDARMREKLRGDVSISKMIVQAAGDRGYKDIVFDRDIKTLFEQKKVTSLYQLTVRDRDQMAYSMAGNLNTYRQQMVFHMGWKDADTSVGRLVKTT